MLGENFDDTPFNVKVDILSELKSQDTEDDLGEPSRPPVDIILGVDQEVCVLSLLSSESQSVSDGSELLNVLDENENTQRDDVEVKGKNLISQPGHHTAVVCGGAAFGEIDSLLNCEDGNEVNEHLEHQEEVSKNSEFIVVQELPQPMGNEANSMRCHGEVHQSELVAENEILGLSSLWAGTFDLVEVLVVGG